LYYTREDLTIFFAAGGTVLEAPNGVLQSPTVIGRQHLKLYRRDGYYLQGEKKWYNNVFHTDGVCTLYIVGDSMVRGLGPYKYKVLRDLDRVTDVHNALYEVAPYTITAAHPGSTTKRVLQSLNRRNVALARSPDIVIFLGTNDAHDIDFKVDDFTKCYREVVSKFFEFSNRIFCVTLLPRFQFHGKNKISLNKINKNIRIINGIIVDIVREIGDKGRLIDLNSIYEEGGKPLWKRTLHTDGLHFKDVGYKEINDLLAERIRIRR
jgi:lysophospholipase L1-like esterase